MTDTSPRQTATVEDGDRDGIAGRDAHAAVECDRGSCCPEDRSGNGRLVATVYLAWRYDVPVFDPGQENCFGAEEDLSSGGARRAWEQEEPAAAVEERSGGGLQDYCVLLGMSAAWPNCDGISPKIPDMEVTALWEETQPRSPPGTV